ncbi:hypothetical protein GGI42DRAFT_324053, partial [Trichoderma sp. SZMC 28013]
MAGRRASGSLSWTAKAAVLGSLFSAPARAHNDDVVTVEVVVTTYLDLGSCVNACDPTHAFKTAEEKPSYVTLTLPTCQSEHATSTKHPDCPVCLGTVFHYEPTEDPYVTITSTAYDYDKPYVSTIHPNCHGCKGTAIIYEPTKSDSPWKPDPTTYTCEGAGPDDPRFTIPARRPEDPHTVVIGTHGFTDHLRTVTAHGYDHGAKAESRTVLPTDHRGKPWPSAVPIVIIGNEGRLDDLPHDHLIGADTDRDGKPHRLVDPDWSIGVVDDGRGDVTLLAGSAANSNGDGKPDTRIPSHESINDGDGLPDVILNSPGSFEVDGKSSSRTKPSENTKGSQKPGIDSEGFRNLTGATAEIGTPLRTFVPGTGVDTNMDGKADTFIDTEGGVDIDADGKPDIHIDVSGNVDTDGDRRPDTRVGISGSVDVNGDGKPDITVGNGPIHTTPRFDLRIVDLGPGTPVDTNFDGLPDLFIGPDGSIDLDGHRVFVKADGSVDVNNDNIPDTMVDLEGNVDIDGDHKPDFKILYAQPDGDPIFTITSIIGAPADADGDGITDAVVNSTGGVLLNDGRSLVIGLNGLVDLNGDGKPDTTILPGGGIDLDSDGLPDIFLGGLTIGLSGGNGLLSVDHQGNVDFDGDGNTDLTLKLNGTVQLGNGTAPITLGTGNLVGSGSRPLTSGNTGSVIFGGIPFTIPGAGVDLDGDHKADTYIDFGGGIDTNSDGQPDLTVSLEGYVDLNMDGIIDGVVRADGGIDTTGDGVPDITVLRAIGPGSGAVGNGTTGPNTPPVFLPLPGMGVDLNMDGQADVYVGLDGGIDVNRDGKAEIIVFPNGGVDLNLDGIPDEKVRVDGGIDLTGEGRPDIYLLRHIIGPVTNGTTATGPVGSGSNATAGFSVLPGLGVDLNNDGKADTTIGLSGEIDTDGDGKPNIVANLDGSVDLDLDGIPDVKVDAGNIDTNSDGKPDITILQTFGANLPATLTESPAGYIFPGLGVDLDFDGLPDTTVKLDGGIDRTGDGVSDLFLKANGGVDSNLDGKADTLINIDGSIDVDADGKPDLVVLGLVDAIQNALNGALGNIVNLGRGNDTNGTGIGNIPVLTLNGHLLTGAGVDLNGDGLPDTTVGLSGVIHRGDGNPDITILPGGGVDINSDGIADTVVLPNGDIDLNSDGKVDLTILVDATSPSTPVSDALSDLLSQALNEVFGLTTNNTGLGQFLIGNGTANNTGFLGEILGINGAVNSSVVGDAVTAILSQVLSDALGVNGTTNNIPVPSDVLGGALSQALSEVLGLTTNVTGLGQFLIGNGTANNTGLLGEILGINGAVNSSAIGDAVTAILSQALNDALGVNGTASNIPVPSDPLGGALSQALNEVLGLTTNNTGLGQLLLGDGTANNSGLLGEILGINGAVSNTDIGNAVTAILSQALNEALGANGTASNATLPTDAVGVILSQALSEALGLTNATGLGQLLLGDGTANNTGLLGEILGINGAVSNADIGNAVSAILAQGLSEALGLNGAGNNTGLGALIGQALGDNGTGNFTNVLGDSIGAVLSKALSEVLGLASNDTGLGQLLLGDGTVNNTGLLGELLGINGAVNDTAIGNAVDAILSQALSEAIGLNGTNTTGLGSLLPGGNVPGGILGSLADALLGNGTSNVTIPPGDILTGVLTQALGETLGLVPNTTGLGSILFGDGTANSTGLLSSLLGLNGTIDADLGSLLGGNGTAANPGLIGQLLAGGILGQLLPPLNATGNNTALGDAITGLLSQALNETLGLAANNTGLGSLLLGNGTANNTGLLGTLLGLGDLGNGTLGNGTLGNTTTGNNTGSAGNGGFLSLDLSGLTNHAVDLNGDGQGDTIIDANGGIDLNADGIADIFIKFADGLDSVDLSGAGLPVSLVFGNGGVDLSGDGIPDISIDIGQGFTPSSGLTTAILSGLGNLLSGTLGTGNNTSSNFLGLDLPALIGRAVDLNGDLQGDAIIDANAGIDLNNDGIADIFISFVNGTDSVDLSGAGLPITSILADGGIDLNADFLPDISIDIGSGFAPSSGLTAAILNGLGNLLGNLGNSTTGNTTTSGFLGLDLSSLIGRAVDLNGDLKGDTIIDADGGIDLNADNIADVFITVANGVDSITGGGLPITSILADGSIDLNNDFLPDISIDIG